MGAAAQARRGEKVANPKMEQRKLTQAQHFMA